MEAVQPNYLVVARRYRPQTFPELIGQRHVAQALMGAISSDRVGHAYLFTGARGVGKTSAARILAKALNCSLGTSPTPCGRCENCQSIASGDDVDVIEIDGASNRGIDEIRQLRQNAAIRPSRARYKIYIIDEVHMLTKEAFNALLKTLEEPPEHVKFIFATTEPNKIPITILSRCQRYDFAGIEAQAIADKLSQIALAEGAEVEPEALQIIAIRAAGSMRDSQSLLEQLLAAGTKQISAADVAALLGLAPAARLRQLVQAFVDRDAATALAHLDAALTEGTEVGQLLDQLLGYLRDAMALSVGCDPSRMLYATPSQHDEVAAFAQKMGLPNLLAAAQILDATAARMRISTQGRTLTEMALVRIATLGDLQLLADVLERTHSGEEMSPSPGIKKKYPTNVASTASDADPAPVRAPVPAPIPDQAPRTLAPLSPASESGPHALQDAASPAVDAPSLWLRTLERLTGMLADHAAAATRFSLDAGGVLVASFPADRRFSRDSCLRATNLARISQALAEAVGRPLGVRFEVHDAPHEPQGVLIQSAPLHRRKGELAEQPFIQRAIELFDGDVQRLQYIPPDSLSSRSASTGVRPSALAGTGGSSLQNQRNLPHN